MAAKENGNRMNKTRSCQKGAFLNRFHPFSGGHVRVDSHFKVEKDLKKQK